LCPYTKAKGVPKYVFDFIGFFNERLSRWSWVYEKFSKRGRL